jgi:cell fate regulator YaaT (PSP1 superfamily)
VISPASPNSVSAELDCNVQVLVRYGNIPQVARYTVDEHGSIDRGASVVVATERGLEIGSVLELVPNSLSDGQESAGTIERLATGEDLELRKQREQEADDAFEDWYQRIEDWNLELELMDMELTLDEGKCILYVLNERGAETTRLALLAAAAGLGIISVQSVVAEGIVDGSEEGGGCGSGCGCSH